MRLKAHQSGDLGCNAVEKIFLAAGWVLNQIKIKRDYGEDLMVQPSPLGIVEKFQSTTCKAI